MEGSQGSGEDGTQLCCHLSWKRTRDAMPGRCRCSLIKPHCCLSSIISGKAHGITTAESRQPMYSVLGSLHTGFYQGWVCCEDSSPCSRVAFTPYHFKREIWLPLQPPPLKYLNLEATLSHLGRSLGYSEHCPSLVLGIKPRGNAEWRCMNQIHLSKENFPFPPTILHKC